MSEQIKVVVKEVGKTPEVRYIDNSIKAMQKIVGGYIQVVPHWPGSVSKKVTMMCNEEGKLRGLEPNFDIPGDRIVGNILITRTDDEGETVSLTESDIARIELGYHWAILREKKDYLKKGYYDFMGNTVMYEGGSHGEDLDSREMVPVEVIKSEGEFIKELYED